MYLLVTKATVQWSFLGKSHHLEWVEWVDFNLNSWNNHFWLKNYFEIPQAPLELLLPSAKQSAQKGGIGQAG